MPDVFEYLERFYIKISLLNCNFATMNINDLFYHKICYNYIYNVEDSLLGLLFLELDSYRNQHKHDSSQLKELILFYVNLLRSTGLEVSLQKFYTMYLDNYKITIDLNLKIGKLLKKDLFGVILYN